MTTIPPLFDESDLPDRLRRLVAMEIDRIVSDLEQRQAWLLELWSRHRDRGPFMDTVFSRWRTLGMTDLALLEHDAAVACEAFYRELDELRLYFQFTQDMPTTMADRYTDALRRVSAYGALALELLGGAPPRPVVQWEASTPPSAPARLATSASAAQDPAPLEEPPFEEPPSDPLPPVDGG